MEPSGKRSEISAVETDDEGQIEGQHKSLKSGSDAVVDSKRFSGPVTYDPNMLRSIHATCLQMFQDRKITEKNAFNCNLLDCLKEIIDEPDFDKNDLIMAGRTLEAGGLIYVRQVDSLHKMIDQLASEIILRKEKLHRAITKTQVGREYNEEQMANEENVDTEKVIKKREKKKRKQFVDPIDSNLTGNFQSRSGKAIARRTDLDKMFTRLINEDVDFDYSSYFMTSDSAHPLKTAEEYASYNELTSFPESHLNLDDMKQIRFLPFNLPSSLDSIVCSVRGMQINSADSAEDTSAETTGQHQPELSLVNPEYLRNPGTTPEKYPEGMHEAVECNDGASQQPTDSIIPATQVQNISSFDQAGQYCTTSRDVLEVATESYGSVETNLFGPRRNKELTETPRMLKRNKERVCTSRIKKPKSNEAAVSCLDEVHPNTEDDHANSNKRDSESDSVIYASQLTQNGDAYPDDSLNVGRIAREICRRVKQDSCGVVLQSDGFLHNVLDSEDDDSLPEMEPVLNDVESLCSSLKGSNEADNENNFKALEATSKIQLARNPKFIDILGLETMMTNILREKLHMTSSGSPTKDEDSTTDILTLFQDVRLRVDNKPLEQLNISTLVASLMNVLAINGLLIHPSNEENPDNAVILCRGKLWDHTFTMGPALDENDKAAMCISTVAQKQKLLAEVHLNLYKFTV